MRERRNLRWEEMDKREIELIQLIQYFEVFNRSEGKSSRTVKWYSDVLNLFLHWLESEGMSDTGEIEKLKVLPTLEPNTYELVEITAPTLQQFAALVVYTDQKVGDVIYIGSTGQ